MKDNDPYREGLKDDASIVFTHGDLHKSNIMVSEDGPIKIRAIVDWEQAGWYPSYWEYCKARYTVGFCKADPWKKVDADGEWLGTYIPKILSEGKEVFEGWYLYVHALGY